MGVWKNGSGYVGEFTKNGKRYRSPTLKDEDQAEAWVLEAKACLLRGLPVPQITSCTKGVSKLSDLIMLTYERKWADNKTGEGTYEEAMRVVKLIGDLPCSTLTNLHVEEVIERLRERDRAAGTINRKLSAFSVVLKLGYELGWIPREIKVRKLRESQGRISVFSPLQERAILDAFEAKGDLDSLDITACLLDTGARLSNVLTMMWGTNVSLDMKRIKFFPDQTKTGNHIQVPMTPRVAEVLSRRADVFPAGPFIGITERAFRYAWDEMRESLGHKGDPEFVPHTCRHTFVTRLLENGVDVLAVKALAGHKSLSTTMRYAHFSSPHLADAIATLTEGQAMGDPMGEGGENGSIPHKTMGGLYGRRKGKAKKNSRGDDATMLRLIGRVPEWTKGADCKGK